MTEPAQQIVINGSHGEGGGALLRTALAVAVLTQQPVRIHSVRGAMRKPGINSEDLCYIRALADLSSARVTGDELGENEIRFEPTRAPKGLNQRIDVNAFESGTVPGNALIVLESLLPVLARSGVYSRVVAQGETHNNNTLSFDAFERVTLAAHRKQGLYAYTNLAIAGFGYGAKGEVGLEVEPSSLEPLMWKERGELLSCTCVVALAGLPTEVGQRGVSHAAKLMKERGLDCEVELVELRAREPGAYVTFFAEFERGIGSGGTCGQRGVRMEHVVESALRNFSDWYDSTATVDSFLADQLLIPAAMADGETVYTTPMVTRRLVTMSWVIKQFLPIHITILGHERQPGTITVSR